MPTGFEGERQSLNDAPVELPSGLRAYLQNLKDKGHIHEDIPARDDQLPTWQQTWYGFFGPSPIVRRENEPPTSDGLLSKREITRLESIIFDKGEESRSTAVIVAPNQSFPDRER